MSRRTFLLPFLAAALALPQLPASGGAAAGGDPSVPPDAGALTCSVEGGTVVLTWNIAFLVPIGGFFLTRDGQQLVDLDASATGYKDTPPAGAHAYVLGVISADGTASTVGSCTVVVGGDQGGLRCSVDGRTVHLSWAPPLIAMAFKDYVVSRDGQLVATLPPDQTSFDDQAPGVGKFSYAVATEPIGEGPSLLIGTCDVEVDCFGIQTKVDGLQVTISWVPPPTPLGPAIIFPNPLFTVLRDGQLIAQVKGSSYTDTVPGPGSYLYEVWFDMGTGGIPAFLFGACQVKVPGDGIPSPADLVCVDLGGLKCVPCGPHNAHLAWTDPIAYDSLVVMRDGAVLAKLDGAATEYLDHDTPVGDHVFSVAGVVGNAQSDAAKCELQIGDGPPAPQELTCGIAVVDPPPPSPGDPAVGESVVQPPFPFFVVLLDWKDPVVYDKVVILRNGMLIATLPGDATAYRDHAAGGGKAIYDVYGIVGGARSSAAECVVDLPPGPVPPPQDLSCAVLDDLSADGSIVTLVSLTWSDPVRYDEVIVSRDGDILAKLPGDSMAYRDVAPPQGKHVYGVQGVIINDISDPAVCEVQVGEGVPPVEGLTCEASGSTVVLTWKDPVDYIGIAVSRNGRPIAKLAGDATGFKDPDLDPGIYLYEVTGFVVGGQSPPAACKVLIEGPPKGNVLFFSSSLPTPIRKSGDPAVGPIGDLPSSRITCLLTNDTDVQGWSFGVASDPKLIVPAKYDLDGTVTAALHGGKGPDFLEVKLLDGGLTMAVVIDTGTDATLFQVVPPGQAQPLLNIEYGAGPQGSPGEVYPVSYSDALGDPPVAVLLVQNGFEVRPVTLPGLVGLPAPRFIRGDATGDGKVDISDPMRILDWLFIEGESARPGCVEAADANGSASVNIADPIYLFASLFNGGSPPPAPFPDCGEARAPLGCDDPGSCK